MSKERKRRCRGSNGLLGVVNGADHMQGTARRQWPLCGWNCRFFSHLWPYSAALSAATGLIVLKLALVAAQPLFDVAGRLICAVIGIRSHALGFQ